MYNPSKTIYSLLLAAILFPGLVYAQGVQYTRKEAGDGGTAVPYPLVTVCTSGAAYTPLPCTPKASIYSDAALTIPLANPFRGDVFGNIEFYATPAAYIASVTAPYSPGYSFKMSASGGFAGTIQDTQVAVGTAANTIGSDGNLIWAPSEEDPPRKKLTVQGGLGVLRPYNYTNALNSTWSIDFGGHQANAATATFGAIQQKVISNTNGAVTGQFDFFVEKAGVPTDVLTLTGTGVIVNASPIFDLRAPAFGGACDNSTDNTTPFNLAVAAAQSAGGGTILFPLGICLFGSKPNNIGNGVKLQGQGWSTNTAVGTSLIRNYVDAGALGFITFDGNGTSARGTGSGVDDMTIGPAVGTTGGYLVKLTSTPACVVGADCDNHRASDTKITNVFLGNGNGGTSACGLYIDGSQNTTGGSQGIRIVNVNNLRVSSTTTADCSIWMNNAAHFMGSNIVIDTGFGATPGVTVTGVGVAPNAAASANVYFSNMELVGDLVIDSASGVQTSGSVLVNGTTTTSANTANSILLGRFATIPTNNSATSTWATVKSAVPFVVPALAATSTGVLTGAAGEVFSITAATTGVLGMGSDHNVTFNRFASDKIGFTGSMFCATTTCSTGMNAGDIQSASSATAGALWLGTDALSFITRNAAGDINSKQKLGFRDGTAFLGLFTSPLTTARTWTFPDGPAAAVMTVNFTTAGATTSDVLTVTGMTASGHCNVSPSNALAATGFVAGTTWLDTPGANAITLHHTNTNGQLFTVSCSSI